MIAIMVTASLVVLISGVIFAASTPIVLMPGLWGNLADLALMGSLILFFCLRDLLSRRKVVKGVVKLCVLLCLPAIVASSEMEWLHNVAELCFLRFHVRLVPGMLVFLLTVVMAGCILLQILQRQSDLRHELLLREADEAETGNAFAWQMGSMPIMMIMAGLLMVLFITAQSSSPVKAFAQAVANRLPPALTVLAGGILMALVVGGYLVETKK